MTVSWTVGQLIFGDMMSFLEKIPVPLSVYVLSYLDMVWVVCIIVCVLVAIDPVKILVSFFSQSSELNDLNLISIAQHGKLSQSKGKSGRKREGIHKYLFVYKSYFTHFYIVGTIFTFFVLMVHFALNIHEDNMEFYCCLPLSLFLMQCSRR